MLVPVAEAPSAGIENQSRKYLWREIVPSKGCANLLGAASSGLFPKGQVLLQHSAQSTYNTRLVFHPQDRLDRSQGAARIHTLAATTICHDEKTSPARQVDFQTRRIAIRTRRRDLHKQTSMVEVRPDESVLRRRLDTRLMFGSRIQPTAEAPSTSTASVTEEPLRQLPAIRFNQDHLSFGAGKRKRDGEAGALGEDEDDDDEDKTKHGRRKIEIEYIKDKSKRVRGRRECMAIAGLTNDRIAHHLFQAESRYYEEGK